MTGALEWMRAAAQERDRAGLTRSLTPMKSDSEMDLAGNDYLGLRHHPAVVAGAAAAAQTYGGGAGASRLVTGTLPVHEELEAALTGLTGAASALVLSSGYAANLAVLSSLADRSTLVVSDAHAHASLIDGSRLARCDVAVTAHNDVDAVEAALASAPPRARRIVIVESIYSVLGDRAPLRDLVEVTERHGALLVVDEAHAIGVAGSRGEGGLAEAGLIDREHVIATGTLSKSLASQGGFVLAHPVVRDHLVNTARPFIYDTGLAPAAAGAALAALDVLTREPHLPARVREHAATLARAAGIPAPDSAVMSVPMPGPQQALVAVATALDAGVRIGCFRPPSTPDGSSRLRLTAHAQHTPDEIAYAASVLTRLVSP